MRRVLPPPNFTPNEIAGTFASREDWYDYAELMAGPEFPNGEFGNEETRYSRLPSDPRELREIDEWGREHVEDYPF